MLACTELPILLDQDQLDQLKQLNIAVVDPNVALAEALLDGPESLDNLDNSIGQAAKGAAGIPWKSIEENEKASELARAGTDAAAGA